MGKNPLFIKNSLDLKGVAKVQLLVLLCNSFVLYILTICKFIFGGGKIVREITVFADKMMAKMLFLCLYVIVCYVAIYIAQTNSRLIPAICTNTCCVSHSAGVFFGITSAIQPPKVISLISVTDKITANNRSNSG